MKLSDKKVQELKDKKISIEELNDRYFINSQDIFEFSNILKLLNENVYNFQEIIDTFKSRKDEYNDPCLYELLRNREVFEELIKNNILNEDDLRDLLTTIDDYYELESVCQNTSLIKHILNEFVLNKELVDKLNRIIEKNKWCNKEYSIFEYIEDRNKNNKEIFELIEFCNKNNEEMLKLIELNEKVCLLNIFNLTKDQKLELIDILKDNEQAQSLLKQLVDNHLEDTYDFEILKELLTKDDKKKKIKMNF